MVSLLLTVNIFHTLSSVSFVNFEQVNAGWGKAGFRDPALLRRSWGTLCRKRINTQRLASS